MAVAFAAHKGQAFILVHHEGFQTDEELCLLGAMAKYAALRGLEYRVAPKHAAV